MYWPAFLRTFVYTAVGLFMVLFAFVVVMNPFGNLPLNLAGPHVIMDINQRFQYPSIVRGHNYDSIVIGTSTARLLNPVHLETAFGGRFANLAMNDGRAWEQAQLANLFVAETLKPNAIFVGLDAVWCSAAADVERISHRGFPRWMYDDDPYNDWLYLLNGKAVEISGRLLANRLGLDDPRIPANGFEVFTPPEADYDAGKAQHKIWGGRKPNHQPVEPAYEPSKTERQSWRYPALKWLADLLETLPQKSKKLLVFMPVHISTQPRPGSRSAARENECKRRIAAIGRMHGAHVVDFRISSPITSNDLNYWDALHYRLPVGEQIIEGTVRAIAGDLGLDPRAGNWRYLSGPDE